MDVADLDVGLKEKTVSVPKVMVVMEEETVSVPSIDLDMPEDDKRELEEKGIGMAEKTLSVEVQVPNDSYNVDIEEVYLANDRYVVISKLDGSGDGSETSNKIKSDHAVINGPDLDVRYYIIGEKPDSVRNNQYTYINSKDDIKNKLSGGKVLYTN